MKIKSFILSIALLSATAAFAQKGELSTAKASYEKYDGMRSMGAKLAMPSLEEAKTSIDKASANEKTANLPETWAIRSLIYADLATSDSVDAKVAPYVDEAVKSISKTQQLDTKGEQKANIEKANRLLAQVVLNKGVRAFKAQNYTEAYSAFDSGLKYMPNDTTFTYYAALSAVSAKNYPNAITKYKQLTSTNFKGLEEVYENLALLYMDQKDTAAAIATAGEGAKKFPQNKNLAQREIEYSLMSGKQSEVISKISAQAAKEPNNKIYPYYLGIAYSSIKDYPKAEEAYKKAIAVDPSYTDAYINLGGLIMNNGIDTYNKANKLPATKQKEYDAMMKQAMSNFDTALPYLQKAAELDPKSKLALSNLKTYYLVKKNSAKADEMQKKIDAL
ncbi:tetratricopeptide repeat protein [Pedobacter sp. HMF7647]|uniref:Tetratricopeptide repeat protein n=1 Tax=Hufsiella arboris TaxID=2695275 RepID=A0A7K1Y7U5_9SPHI|nr:tetratricopeptide repeat protein [Hufsiella arboris]MXV50664.1 tetratricopeptide repeat protein [Hufsiella arboris]